MVSMNNVIQIYIPVYIKYRRDTLVNVMHTIFYVNIRYHSYTHIYMCVYIYITTKHNT